VKKEGAHKLSEKAAWRRGMLVFDQVSLADAAAEFNRYNDTKIRVQDKKAARRTIGATFPIHNVAEFVDVAQDVLKLHVEKRDHEIVISE
jgi:transmembrane sensor